MSTATAAGPAVEVRSTSGPRSTAVAPARVSVSSSSGAMPPSGPTTSTMSRSVSRPHGFNLGMNQGEVAGAGIAAHLHQHVVPRWRGDANFLPIIAQTKAVPELLDDARARLAAAWPEEA